MTVDFSPEALKRLLTLPEAACLWCNLPFTLLQTGVETEPGLVYSFEHPEFNQALAALVDATDTLELDAGRTEDGYAVRVEKRIILRDDLCAWLEQYHPAHRPASLFAAYVPKPAIKHGDEHAQATRQPIPPEQGDDTETMTSRDILSAFRISRATLESWLETRGVATR